MESQPPSQTPWISPNAPSTPPSQPPRKTPSWVKALLVLLFLGLGGSVLLNLILMAAVGMTVSMDADAKIQEKFHSRNASASDKIAIITVEGAILEGDGFIKRQIDRAKKDTSVKAVVLRVVSPGGTVSGSDFLYHHLRKLADERKIPIVVSMGGIAASGGYYLSMSVGDTPESIFAEPATWTGSIGVVIPHYNLAGLMDEWGIKEDSIASHRLKTMGSFTKPMTEEERKILQSLVDESFGHFKEIIRAGRPKFRKEPAALDKLATGQIFTAKQALDAGLIDKIGFIDDAISRAIALAGLTDDTAHVVKYKPEPSLTSLLLGTDSQSRRLDPAAILDLAAPRAYYLYTALPPMLDTSRRQP